MVNPMKLMKLTSAWDQFQTAHPQFLSFLQAVYPQNIQTGTVLDVSVAAPDGKPLRYRMTVTSEDMALFDELQGMLKDK